LVGFDILWLLLDVLNIICFIICCGWLVLGGVILFLWWIFCITLV